MAFRQSYLTWLRRVTLWISLLIIALCCIFAAFAFLGLNEGNPFEILGIGIWTSLVYLVSRAVIPNPTEHR